MQQNTLLESYLRQLKLPTFAQNYAAIASDAACYKHLAVSQNGRGMKLTRRRKITCYGPGASKRIVDLCK